MASRGSNGFGGQRHKEKDSEEDAELEGRRGGAPRIEESSLAGNLDCWNLSSSQEILEDEELLGELEDYQHLLEEGEQSFDLSELQDLECAGEVNATSPLPEDKGSPEDLGMRSYWQPDQMHEEGSTEGLKKPRGTWGIGSQEDVYPELSFEGQYGSDFSPSPEALQDPLALYKSSFASDNVDDELSESSNFSPSPCGPPPRCTQLEIEPQSLGGDGLDFPEDRKHSLESGRSLESPRLSSLASSLPYNQRLLDFQSLEDLQDSPSIEAETLPELSWMENSGQPLAEDPSAETAQPPQQRALNSSKTEERFLDSGKVTQMPHAQGRVGCRLEERTQKMKADAPRGLLSKGTRQSRSLSPQWSPSQKKSGHLALKEPDRGTLSTPGARDIAQYGRGQLNYPLPDLSKVEPRVKFPKDPQSYHPPQGKTSPASSKVARKPVIFKSPAEIVREVLLSSGEGSPQKGSAPTVSVIPEELKSPRQATELVHQLQEDYHKLLTKYAEAENTIDRLRLTAKVRLYSDPLKSSQAGEMGRISEASKVVTFSIPQIRTAEITRKSSQASRGAQGEGFPGQQAQHSSLGNSTGLAASGTNSPISTKTPFLGDHLTQLLAAQASKFQTQMEFLEELIQTDRLDALDQLKGFARLKEAQQALEQAYLQARNKYQQLQNQKEPVEMLGEFDPNRAVEGNVFHLGMRLEALKERIEQPTWSQRVAPDGSQLVVPSSPCFPVQLSEEHVGSPKPSLQAPVPAVCIPYPETSSPQRSFTQVQLEGDASSISDGTGEEEGDFLELPQPFRHQEEEDNFDPLLDQCSSFNSLPAALSHKHNTSSKELGSAATTAAGTKGGSLQKSSAAAKKTPTTSKKLQKEAAPALPLRKAQQPAHWIRHASSTQAAATLSEPPEINSPPAAVPKMSSRRQQAEFSSHSSMASGVGSTTSEPAGPKLPQKLNMTLPEDLRILSPETDSGFVGSEVSRTSPLAQMSRMRSHSTQRPSATLDVPPCSPSSKKASGAVKELGPAKSPGPVKLEGGRSGHTLTKRSPFQKNSLCRWTNEMEPEGNENSHTDSETETEAHAGISLDGTSPPHGRHLPSSSPTSLNLAQARRHHHHLIDSRLERDKAIAALQHEVSQLRQSLEETLHRRSSSSHPAGVQGSAHLSPSVTPAGTSGKSMVESDQSFLATEPNRRAQKPSLAQDGSQLDFNPSESDGAPSKSQNGGHHAAPKIKPSKQPTVQGPYTGTWYPISAPTSEEPKTRQASVLCLCHPPVKLQHGEAPASHLDDKETKGCDSPRDGSRPSKPRGAGGWLCSLCKDSANSRSKDTAGAGDGKENAPEETTRRQPKFNHQQQPKQTGIWYLAVPSAATSVNYIPTIPLAPYPLSSVIYSPLLGTTSVSPSMALPAYGVGGQQATEWKASWQGPQDGHCCSRTFGCTRLEDLNWTLSRAVEAAKDMKATTQQMSKSLSWALRKARSPRTSCLF